MYCFPGSSFTARDREACCHPDDEPPLKRAVASARPSGDHKVPTCLPVLARAL